LESINIRSSPDESALFEDLRTVEGLLSFYGVNAIEVNKLESEWLPETEEERNALAVRKFTIGRVSAREKGREVIPFEYVCQSFLAASSASHAQIPLSFYRKGQIDMQEERFIDAIYDFYFVFEHLYAAGQYRAHQVKAAFKACQPMCNAVVAARGETRCAFDNPQQRKYFEEKYIEAGEDAVLDHIVDLRGRLHHHSARRKGQSWHPSLEREYRVDAGFFHHMAFSICFDLAKGIVFSDSTVAQCRDIQAYEASR
jgi:hypothetical protein